MGIVIKVAGRQMQQDFEPVLERQIHYFINGASGIQHIGQREEFLVGVDQGFLDALEADLAGAGLLFDPERDERRLEDVLVETVVAQRLD